MNSPQVTAEQSKDTIRTQRGVPMSIREGLRLLTEAQTTQR